MEIIHVQKALVILQNSELMVDLIPEVRSNLVMARENAQTIEDVVGVPGRITTVNGRVRAFLKPEWGASSHMARMVLEIMKYDPERRSAINLRYDPDIIKICEKLGLKVSFYNRADEPEDLRKVEGKTISWGVEQAIKNLGEIPDVIYHLGDWGKEPIIALIGNDAIDVAKMAVCLAELLNNKKKMEKVP
ncbi:MAG: thiamine-phosphate synthase [Methanobacterium sp.]|nr:thiamine-phosphate synthase [Methanobacterium sp.]